MADHSLYVRHYKRGHDLYTAGHYEEALAELKKALVCNPEFPDIYDIIARIYTERKKYSDAISMYEKLVTFFPNDLEIQCEYAKTLIRTGEEKKGEKTLLKILKLNPNEHSARIELFKIYVRQDNLKKALQIAETGIKAHRNLPLYYCLAGDALRRQMKLNKAQKYYEKALEIDHNHEPSKRGINAVVRSIDLPQGEKSFLRRPEEDAREELVVAAQLFAEKQYDQAIIRLLDLRDLPSVQREATMLLGLAFSRKGLYKRAHDVFLTFIQDHEPDIQVLYHLGLALNRMGRFEDAIPYLAEALEIDTEYQEALLEMGVACQMTGHLVEAREYLVHALKGDKNDPRPYVHLARIAYDKGDRAKVAEFFRRAQSLDPRNPEIEYIRGYIAVNEEKYDEALTALRKYLEYCPDHFEALKLLGRAYMQVGDYENAVECYRSAASLNPSDLQCKAILNELAMRV